MRAIMRNERSNGNGAVEAAEMGGSQP
jgi:putative multiple sugar transport system ATP-binding protein